MRLLKANTIYFLVLIIITVLAVWSKPVAALLVPSLILGWGIVLMYDERDRYKFLYETYFQLNRHYSNLIDKRADLIQGVADENIIKDRLYLLRMLAVSFYKADKLFIEKKHPNSKNIILGFQVKNGNLRFSIPEEQLPQIVTMPITINNAKINYNNNYKFIEELLKE